MAWFRRRATLGQWGTVTSAFHFFSVELIMNQIARVLRILSRSPKTPPAQKPTIIKESQLRCLSRRTPFSGRAFAPVPCSPLHVSMRPCRQPFFLSIERPNRRVEPERTSLKGLHRLAVFKLPGQSFAIFSRRWIGRRCGNQSMVSRGHTCSISTRLRRF